MKQPKCSTCDGKGWYIGVVPPGRDVKCKCWCGGPKPRFNVFNKMTGELAVMRKVTGSKTLYKITFFRGNGPKVRGFTFHKDHNFRTFNQYWGKL